VSLQVTNIPKSIAACICHSDEPSSEESAPLPYGLRVAVCRGAPLIAVFDPGSPTILMLDCWGGGSGVPNNPDVGLLGWRVRGPQRAPILRLLWWAEWEEVHGFSHAPVKAWAFMPTKVIALNCALALVVTNA
jgi:hypothetical protein